MGKERRPLAAILSDALRQIDESSDPWKNEAAALLLKSHFEQVIRHCESGAGSLRTAKPETVQ